MGPRPPAASGRALESPRFVPGSIIASRYRVVSMLGRGGMGEVYRAEDLRLNQSVAIKFLPPEIDRDPHKLERLHSEVRLARDIAHPNVARVYDIGESNGEHYLTMEFVDGEDLASLLRRVGRPNPEKAVEIARQICAGVGAMHDRGVLHRDLKPANIMLDGHGRVRIMDFGLALRSGPDSSTGVVAHAAGTPAYMAPEQWTGGTLTVATDLYAIGMILHELFTGRTAVAGKSLEDFRRWHLSTPAESLSDSMALADPALERIIVQCLAKDPARRPPSALAVASMLPGGDPIAAALAAGETPSPEMVAAAGRAERLSTSAATGLAISLLVLTIIWLIVPSPYRPWDFAAPRKSPEVLSDRAEQLLATGEEQSSLRGFAVGYSLDDDMLKWLERSVGVDTLDRLGQGRLDPIGFYLRRASEPLAARSVYGRVTLDDPPFDVPSMERVRLTSDGKLRSIERVPALEIHEDLPAGASPAAARRSESAPSEDISRLMREAGIDPESVVATTPRLRPRFFAHELLAWQEREAIDGVVFRIEAAITDGRISSFQVIGPWKDGNEAGGSSEASSNTISEPSSEASSDPSSDSSSDPVERIVTRVMVGIMLTILVSMVVLAFRHARAGRGDLRGAHTLALAVVAIAFLRWLCLCDMSVSPAFLERVFNAGLAVALLSGAIAWILYMALEPFTRRAWPSMMITWQRLIRGRLTDPQVGRDLFVGCLGGIVILLSASLAMALERRFGGMPPIEYARSAGLPWLTSMMGGLRPVGLILIALQSGVIVPMGALMLLVVLRTIVRKPWIAAIVAWVLFTLPSAAVLPQQVFSVIAAGVISAVTILLLVRYGLVAVLGLQIFSSLLIFFPYTSDSRAWFFALGLCGIIAGLALAGFGLWAATAGRSTAAWRSVK